MLTAVSELRRAEDTARSDRVPKYYTAVLVLILTVELLAVWLPAYSALTDFPVHVVRTQVLADYDSSPLYQRLFIKSVLPNPNMAIDYLATPLVRYLGPVAAGKVFLSLVVVLFVGGCHLLGRAIHGASSWVSLGCALLAFHGSYQDGFANYSFSLGLLLVGLALWYRWRAAWTASRLLCLSALLTALFVAHLVGFGVALVVMGAFWLRETFEHRLLSKRTVLEAAAFLPAFGIWLSLPRSHGVAIRWGLIEWSTPLEKLAGSFTLFRSGSTVIDAVTCVVLALLAFLVVRRRCDYVRSFLGVGLLLYGISLVMPRRFLIDSSGADQRLMIPALLFCLLALRFPESRLGRHLGIAIFVLLGCRLLYQYEMSRRASRVTQNVVELVDRIPSGERFWMVLERQRIFRRNCSAGAYGLIRSGAITTGYIALPFQQPIWFRHPPTDPQQMPAELTVSLAGSTLRGFRYTVVCGFGGTRNQALAPFASEVAASGPCSLWRTKDESAVQPARPSSPRGAQWRQAMR